MEDDLIKCPFCEQTDYIVEREKPVVVYVPQPDKCKYCGSWLFAKECSIKEFKFFCTYCKKDFNDFQYV